MEELYKSNIEFIMHHIIKKLQNEYYLDQGMDKIYPNPYCVVEENILREINELDKNYIRLIFNL
jgi:hypothetical protein